MIIAVLLSILLFSFIGMVIPIMSALQPSGNLKRHRATQYNAKLALQSLPENCTVWIPYCKRFSDRYAIVIAELSSIYRAAQIVDQLSDATFNGLRTPVSASIRGGAGVRRNACDKGVHGRRGMNGCTRRSSFNVCLS
jgi:hypothetical protein